MNQTGGRATGCRPHALRNRSFTLLASRRHYSTAPGPPGDATVPGTAAGVLRTLHLLPPPGPLAGAGDVLLQVDQGGETLRVHGCPRSNFDAGLTGAGQGTQTRRIGQGAPVLGGKREAGR